jgi:hypothetical protein
VVRDEPGRAWQLAHVGDQVDGIGRTRREEVAGAGDENLFCWSESNA